MGSLESSSRTAQHERQLRLALALTGAYLLVEVVAGLVTHSLALLADAGHMLTDAGGLVLALLAIRFAQRPASLRHTYGYYRAEILAALINAVALLGISAYILFEAWRRFLDPPAVESGGMLLVAVVGLAVNIASMRLLHGGAADSINVRGAYLEVLSDFVSSIGVLIAGAVIWFTGWLAIDPLISAGIGLFIIPRTWRLLVETVNTLLEGTPPEVDLEALRQTIGAVTGVAEVHDLHVWALTSGVNALSAHVVCAGSPDGELLGRVHQCVRAKFPISHVTVQLEPRGWAETETHL